MPHIYLARHGQDQDNAAGILNGRRNAALTELGISQAQALAAKIKSGDFAIGKIFSSPLQRAYRTAEIVADSLGLAKPEKVELLIERDFGVMTGKLVADIEPTCAPDIIKCNPVVYFLSPTEGETFPQLFARGQEIVRYFKGLNMTENILLVSHGDIGKMIYAAFYQLEWESVLKEFHLGNSEMVVLDRGSRPEDRFVFTTTQYNP
jgi:broad specificity phosphatase PhoE